MAKREITAREAKQNLEPFGYKGPAKWASIDAFVEANPRAKAAVTANKGMFVQSEALGFTDFTMTSDLHISHDGQWLPFGWHINSYSLNVSTDQYTPNIKPIAEARLWGMLHHQFDGHKFMEYFADVLCERNSRNNR